MMTVLAVDDSQSIRQMVVATLVSNGYEVEQAEDGQIGLQLASEKDYDVIISDVNMPNMGGYDFVRALRELKGHQHTPVLMLTTEFEPEQKQQGRAAGANGWIIKPIDPDQLIKAVMRVTPD